MIPSLYGGYIVQAGSTWKVAILRPGDDPIGNLASVLCDPDALGAGGTDTEMGLALVDSTLRREGGGAPSCPRGTPGGS